MLSDVAILNDIQARLREQMPTLRQRFGVTQISVFGSYARGEQTQESDLDLLVEFERTPGMFIFVGLADYLEFVLKLKVDLATHAMLRPRLRPHIMKDLVSV